jgi:hypothetical protein
MSHLLSSVGRDYEAYRTELIRQRQEGLTSIYNCFHDPDDHDPDIVKLRELHDAMDRAVLDAYGWTDVRPACEFILDFEGDDEETPGKASRRKKPWRYRWPDDVRDEVLGRLLELNARRAKEEALAGAAPANPGSSGPKDKIGKKGGKPGTTPLLDM